MDCDGFALVLVDDNCVLRSFDFWGLDHTNELEE